MNTLQERQRNEAAFPQLRAKFALPQQGEIEWLPSVEGPEVHPVDQRSHLGSGLNQGAWTSAILHQTHTLK
jgi:hypothetical protein